MSEEELDETEEEYGYGGEEEQDEDKDKIKKFEDEEERERFRTRLYFIFSLICLVNLAIGISAGISGSQTSPVILYSLISFGGALLFLFLFLNKISFE